MDDAAAAAAYLPPPQTQPPPPGSVLSYVYYHPQPLPQPSPPAIPTQQYYYLPRHLIPQPRPDELRTLFVAGLPDDVKAREIYNLFREFPGYESSHLRTSGKNSQRFGGLTKVQLKSAAKPNQDNFFHADCHRLSEPFAFAVFLDQQSAVAAMHALNVKNGKVDTARDLGLEGRTLDLLIDVAELMWKGMVFDLEKKCTLYIDLAKSNSRSKRPRDDERQGFDKRAKVLVRYSSATHGSGIGSSHLPGIHNSAYSKIGYPTAQSYVIFEDRGINESATVMMSTSSALPCPTLFVANLGPRCTENELFHVFSRCPGFQKVKVQVKHGGPVAFVDFKDTACSTGAINLLQGTILHSSPASEGIRLEYARSRMGMRGKGK